MALLFGKKGTCALVFSLAEDTLFDRVGQFREVRLPRGHYICVGSAFGKGGVRGWVARHLLVPDRRREHLDYVRRSLTPLEVWFTYGPTNLACDWVRVLRYELGGDVRVYGFGVTRGDPCSAHFLHFVERPDYARFVGEVQRHCPDHPAIERLDEAEVAQLVPECDGAAAERRYRESRRLFDPLRGVFE
jgi:Uri superfamily endonuclease